jgi:2'-hydroxyisoflavone reductase
MRNSRREFLKAAAAAGAGLAVPGRLLHADRVRISRDPEKLKLLILGGTLFLGPETVNAAVARGHTVTLFNRGKTNPHLFPDLEKLQGDRDGQLDALKGREWDAVIDTSANVPRWVNLSAGLLKDHVRHYIYISSISVYPNLESEDSDESSPVGTIDDPKVEKIPRPPTGRSRRCASRRRRRRCRVGWRTCDPD